jgi:hypothetical protein
MQSPAASCREAFHMMNHEELGMMQSVEVYDGADGPTALEGAAICSSPRK